MSKHRCHADRMKIKKAIRFQVSAFSVAHIARSSPPSAPPASSEIKMAATNSSAARRTITPTPASGVRCSRLKLFSHPRPGEIPSSSSPNKFLRAVRAFFLHPAQTLERDVP